MPRSKFNLTRRGLLTTAASAALVMPMINHAWAQEPSAPA